MTRLPHLALAALLVAGTGTAQAAPPKKKPVVKPVCNLMSDPPGDGTVHAVDSLPGGSLVPSSDSLDVLGGDFATGAKTIKATITMKSLEKDAWTTYEISYQVAFSVGGTSYYFDLTQGANSSDQATLNQGFTKLGDVAASIDETKKTITFSASRSLTKALKPGGKIGEFTFRTEAFGTNADSASNANLTYIDRTPSCLKPL